MSSAADTPGQQGYSLNEFPLSARVSISLTPTSVGAVGDMFTRDQLHQLSYCVGEELRARMAGKRPGVQPWLRNLVHHLDLAVAMSESGHRNHCDTTQSDVKDLISAREAAAILKLSKRQAQRLGPALGAEVVDGRWLFPRRAVEDYAKGRHDG